VQAQAGHGHDDELGEATPCVLGVGHAIGQDRCLTAEEVPGLDGDEGGEQQVDAHEHDCGLREPEDPRNGLVG